jgi:hypothetical protein
LTIAVFSATSQDLLIKRDRGDTIKAVVIFIYADFLKYRKFENTASTVIEIPKYELSKVIYANGKVEDFTQWKKPKYDTIPAMVLDSSKVLHDLGMTDADKYYKGFKPAGASTFIASALLSPLAGVAFAGLTTAEPPTDNLGFPDETFKSNPYYKDGYTTAATRKKSKKVWTNFYFGSLTWVALVALFSSLPHHIR